jgi:hypothetical protein
VGSGTTPLRSTGGGKRVFSKALWGEIPVAVGSLSHGKEERPPDPYGWSSTFTLSSTANRSPLSDWKDARY